MNQINIEERVKRIKNQFEALAKDPSYSFTLEPVSKEDVSLLKSKDYFPTDMLLILENIGCMRNFSHNGCQMIDWWIPSSIEHSMAEDRSAYDLIDSNFINSQELLFFAYVGNAVCYFFDTKISPWKVVVCDGLAASDDREDKLTPWEEPYFPNALSIIENWLRDTY